MLEIDRQKELVESLRRYEAAFLACDGTDSLSHYKGLIASGLTEDGLCLARSLVGKYPSGKPGILAWLDQPQGIILTVAEREATGWKWKPTEYGGTPALREGD